MIQGSFEVELVPVEEGFDCVCEVTLACLLQLVACFGLGLEVCHCVAATEGTLRLRAVGVVSGRLIEAGVDFEAHRLRFVHL